MEQFDPKGFLRKNVCTNFYDNTHPIIRKIICEDSDLQQKIREVVKGKRVI